MTPCHTYLQPGRGHTHRWVARGRTSEPRVPGAAAVPIPIIPGDSAAVRAVVPCLLVEDRRE